MSDEIAERVKDMQVINVTKDCFEEVVLRADKPVLVDFWAPWCGYCRRIGPVLDQIAQQYGDKLTVCKIDIDQEPQLAEQYGVEIIPTLFLFKNGAKSEPIVNPSSKAQILEWMGL